MHILMKPLMGVLAGGTLLLALLTATAHAIVIESASLSSGTVTVSGDHAAKDANITWETTVVAESTKGGAFSFTTAVVPSDCVGTLSDGVSTIDVAISGCTPPPTTAFPATGQTTSYATGDDGDIQAGATLSYTTNSDGTITDNNTGLVWEKKTATCSGDIHCWTDTYPWPQAFSVFIAALNTAHFAGHSDWRLPNVKELQSIVNYQNVHPAVSAAFNDDAGSGCSSSCTQASFYWSSTTYAPFAGPFAWDVYFNDGFVSPNAKDNNFYVRAVRGGL